MRVPTPAVRSVARGLKKTLAGNLAQNLALCVALAGCLPVEGTPPPRPIPGPQPVADLAQCGGNGLYRLIGRSVTILPKHGSWAALRVIQPGMMVTMDYSATRLNVHIDRAGRIVSLNCG